MAVGTASRARTGTPTYDHRSIPLHDSAPTGELPRALSPSHRDPRQTAPLLDRASFTPPAVTPRYTSPSAEDHIARVEVLSCSGGLRVPHPGADGLRPGQDARFLGRPVPVSRVPVSQVPARRILITRRPGVGGFDRRIQGTRDRLGSAQVAMSLHCSR